MCLDSGAAVVPGEIILPTSSSNNLCHFTAPRLVLFTSYTWSYTPPSDPTEGDDGGDESDQVEKLESAPSKTSYSSSGIRPLLIRRPKRGEYPSQIRQLSSTVPSSRIPSAKSLVMRGMKGSTNVTRCFRAVFPPMMRVDPCMCGRQRHRDPLAPQKYYITKKRRLPPSEIKSRRTRRGTAIAEW
jgi:hypothetical protein